MNRTGDVYSNSGDVTRANEAHTEANRIKKKYSKAKVEYRNVLARLNLESPSTIFFSYNWTQQEAVRKLALELSETKEYNVWLDVNQMGGGEWLSKEIVSGIYESKVVVVFLSPEYLNSENCCTEIKLAKTWKKKSFFLF